MTVDELRRSLIDVDGALEVFTYDGETFWGKTDGVIIGRLSLDRIDWRNHVIVDDKDEGVTVLLIS
jgi:hypothetical protein